MKTSRIGFALIVPAVLLLCPPRASAFPKDVSGGRECAGCHRLTSDEAAKILGEMVDNVLNVEQSPVPGLWVVDVAKGDRKVPVYVDYSKNFVLGGQLIRIGTKEDLTGARMAKLNEVKVDVLAMPIADALILGNRAAKKRVVVFSDPDCGYCAKLHGELRTVVEKKPDVAFHIKLYSRNGNPVSAGKARSVICTKSMAMLEDAYAKKPVPPATCTTDAPEKTFELARKLNIHGTPTLVLPDGRVLPGYRDANALMQLLAE